MGEFHQGADSLEHLARGQIARDISPRGIKMGAEASKHLARGQIDDGISPGGK